jgi:hypothetical protein
MGKALLRLKKDPGRDFWYEVPEFHDEQLVTEG